MKRPITKSMLAATLLTLCASAWSQSPPPAPVAVDKATADSYSSLLWVPGSVISKNDARISAETDGSITWVAEVGEFIEAGQPIATIDHTDLELELEDRLAMLESLKAREKYQQNNLQRLNSLAAQSNASVNQLDEAIADHDMTLQEIRRAEVTIRQTRRRIEQTKVVAPFSGVVVERVVQLGEFVNRGAQVARVVDTENREIRAQAPLSASEYVHAGLEVSVEYHDRQSLSPINRVIPVGDERSRMFEVRVAVIDPSWVIGSAVKIALPSSDFRKMVAVPRDALVLRGSEMFVLKVGENNTVEKVNVNTGIGLGSRVEIIGEIKDGDRVVTRGAERLQAGQSVIITGGP